MHTPQQRDEKTVAIATALGLLGLALALGTAVLWAANAFLSLTDPTLRILGRALMIAAPVAPLAYLVRARRR